MSKSKKNGNKQNGNNVEEKMKLPSPTIYEIISRGGQEELERPFQSLSWSAFVAGICISFSPLCEAILKLHLGGMKDSFLIENFGYAVGFIIVIMGRFQLFTENTITVILPLLEKFNLKQLARTAQVWGIVLALNLVGTFTFALLVTHFNFMSEEQFSVLLDVSDHAINRHLPDIFIQAIPAGFLIAALVWLLPNAEGAAQLWIIALMTYVIAIGDFAHIVAGSAEAFLLLLNDGTSWAHGAGYLVMACLGNILGGTGLFALMAYAQVKEEM